MITYSLSTQKLAEKHPQDKIKPTYEETVYTPRHSKPDIITEYPSPKDQQALQKHHPLGRTCGTFQDLTHKKKLQIKQSPIFSPRHPSKIM